jgi:hypothetical protein
MLIMLYFTVLLRYFITTYTPDDGLCETDSYSVVVEGYEIGVFKPGTAQKAVQKTVFVYLYIK